MKCMGMSRMIYSMTASHLTTCRRLHALLAVLLMGWSCSAAVAAEKRPPNVIVILADDLGYPDISLCDGWVSTPHIDRLAGEGMTLTDFHSNSSVCSPTRAAFLTGRYQQRVGIVDVIVGAKEPDQGLPASTTTLAGVFQKNGYATAIFGKWHLGYQDRYNPVRHGFDEFVGFLNGGADYHQHQDWRNGLKKEDISGYSTDIITRKSVDFIKRHKGKPFFLAVGYIRPHVPLVAPEKYFDQYQAEALTLPDQVEDDLADVPRFGQVRVGARTGTDTDAKRKQVLQAYYASVSFMDAQVGRLLDALEQQGLADNTLIVFMSDHGYHLGEHDFWQKLSLHEESARIPMIAAGPGIEPGKRWGGLMEAVDVYPSLCVFAGLPIPEHCVGLDMVSAKQDPRKTAYSMTNRGDLIRTDRWAYMRYQDGAEELYDMQADPKQFKNLAGDAGSADALKTMRALLDQKLK